MMKVVNLINDSLELVKKHKGVAKELKTIRNSFVFLNKKIEARRSFNFLTTKNGNKVKLGNTLIRNYLSVLTPKDSILQCSDTKKGAYMFKPKYYAVNHNFIQFRSKDYVRTLSVDIDTKQDYNTEDDILVHCENVGLPEPTMIVNTPRGWHIHWWLRHTISLTDKYQSSLYKETIKGLNVAFDADTNAAGYIFRNPLKHNTRVSHNTYSLSDFYEAVDIDDVYRSFVVSLVKATEDLGRLVDDMASNNKEVLKGKTATYDLTKISEGNRNSALLHNIRTYSFRNFINLTEAKLIKKALQMNNEFVEPLTDAEVINTTKSVFKFVKRVYNPSFKVKSKEFIMALSGYIRSKSLLKILNGLEELFKSGKASPVDFLKGRLYKKTLAKLVKVDIKTYRKYLTMVTNIIALMYSQKDCMDRIMVSSNVLDGYDLIVESVGDGLEDYINSAIKEVERRELSGIIDYNLHELSVKYIPKSLLVKDKVA